MNYSPTSLTVEQETALEQWLDELNESWYSAIKDEDSPESEELKALAEAESEWLERQDYYHLAYSDCDRI